MTIRRIAVILAVVTMLGVMLFGATACGKKPGEPRDPNKEELDLIRYYLKMKEIGLAGDKDTFNEMRDSLTHAKIQTYFSHWERVIDSKKVSDWAYNWPDIAGLPIVEDTSDGEWRRLVFRGPWIRDIVDRQDSLNPGREKAIYPLIMFRNNNGTWKVSNASRWKSYRYDNDGNEIKYETFSPHYHKFYRIPPDFIDLEKLPTDSVYHSPKPSGIVDTTKRAPRRK